jgi:NADH:ubiquinone oxidoreductase subunit
MYTNGDYPFKFGTYMGSDAAGNRYYENRVDYPFGQHRWVEPGDAHNFDSTSIPPEWQGWMTSMNDDPPVSEQEYINAKTEKVDQMCKSNAPDKSNVGHQEELYNFNHLHNLTQVRSRGYGIGNPIVGLPPGVKDSYYTQPGSPYNDASIRPLQMVGSLDKDGGRAYKNEKWADRLRTADEKMMLEKSKESDVLSFLDAAKSSSSRGGTSIGR